MIVVIVSILAYFATGLAILATRGWGEASFDELFLLALFTLRFLIGIVIVIIISTFIGHRFGYFDVNEEGIARHIPYGGRQFIAWDDSREPRVRRFMWLTIVSAPKKAGQKRMSWVFPFPKQTQFKEQCKELIARAGSDERPFLRSLANIA